MNDAVKALSAIQKLEHRSGKPRPARAAEDPILLLGEPPNQIAIFYACVARDRLNWLQPTMTVIYEGVKWAESPVVAVFQWNDMEHLHRCLAELFELDAQQIGALIGAALQQARKYEQACHRLRPPAPPEPSRIPSDDGIVPTDAQLRGEAP